MSDTIVIDGEVELLNVIDGDPDVVIAEGGGIVPTGTIEITENGTYNVTDYAQADVDVQGGITPTGTKQIAIASNGTVTEDVTSYANAEINVNVPASAVDTGTKSINSNGTHDVVGYASASVNVPNSYSASDEGKVVSNGALVAQTSDTVTANNTYDTTLINSLTVNVSGGGGYSIDDINESNITGDITITGTYIKAFRFAYTSITSVNAPNATTINGVFYNGGVPDGSAFAYCQSLQTVSAPLLTRLGMSTFAFCLNLTSVYLPSVTNYDSAPFHKCEKLTVIAFPSMSATIKSIGQTPKLTTLDFGGGTSIDAKALNSSEKLSTLILRNSQVTTLSNVNAFNTSHPFGASGTGGTLYVPSALISSYQSATNWGTILGYANNQIKSIESTHTDPNAPIDLTLYYADGTLIPTT